MLHFQQLVTFLLADGGTLNLWPLLPSGQRISAPLLWSFSLASPPLTDMGYKALTVLGLDANQNDLAKSDLIIFLYAIGLVSWGGAPGCNAVAVAVCGIFGAVLFPVVVVVVVVGLSWSMLSGFSVPPSCSFLLQALLGSGRRSWALFLSFCFSNSCP